MSNNPPHTLTTATEEIRQMRYAHFFTKTKRQPAEVIITETPALNSGVLFQSYVANKTEARKAAKSHDAQCWNF